MKFPNKIYDILKWVTMIVIPGLGTLYSALAAIWGFPLGEQIVSTCAAVTAFLGVVLGISNYNYKKQADK